MSDKPDILNLDEAADYLRVHRSTMYRLLKREPPIPGTFKVGSDWRFTRQGLEKFVAQGGTVDSTDD